jgi:hypothetical protein
MRSGGGPEHAVSGPASGGGGGGGGVGWADERAARRRVWRVGDAAAEGGGQGPASGPERTQAEEEEEEGRGGDALSLSRTVGGVPVPHPLGLLRGRIAALQQARPQPRAALRLRAPFLWSILTRDVPVKP